MVKVKYLNLSEEKKIAGVLVKKNDLVEIHSLHWKIDCKNKIDNKEASKC